MVFSARFAGFMGAFLFLASAFSVLPSSAVQAQGSDIRVQKAINGSGLPIPRFVSLRSDEVNLRTGPGLRYPIGWVYHVKGLPLEVVAEYENWRQVRDVQGDTGWVHTSILAGKRTALVAQPQSNLYRKASFDAPVIAMIKRHVVVELMECTGQWCYVNAKGFDGWMRQAALWGIYDGEALD